MSPSGLSQPAAGGASGGATGSRRTSERDRAKQADLWVLICRAPPGSISASGPPGSSPPMRYWWVNQKQTYRHEVQGGYLWSPKTKSDGSMNPFYEFMREVSPGDLVFSYANTHIRAFGVARSYAYEAPKPPEFGATGRNWDEIGWRVDVDFTEHPRPVRPADWIELLRPLLPRKYAPLQASSGYGVQSVYLTELPEPLALQIATLLGDEVSALARRELLREAPERREPEVVFWEEHLRRRIEQSPELDETEKESLVQARRGQGLFRSRVQEHEQQCRITRVDRLEHLRASHCKPWRDSTNGERLDGQNGLLLTPSIDHLFDRGFISFRDDGRLLRSPVAHLPSLEKLGVPVSSELDTGSFTDGQRRFVEYHRDCVFLRSRVSTPA